MREEITLSTGETISVGVLTWAAYKQLKTLILKRLSQQDLTRLFELFQQKDFQGLAEMLLGLMEQVDGPFIQGCLDSPLALDNLPFPDVLQLVKTATRLNPVEGFFELEKNSFSGGLIATAIKTLATSNQTQDHLKELLAGGSESSTPSPGATAGL